ncbi:hypothetical protein ACMAVI_000192 [Burkholderia cenocepacia]|nr:hypothetical protein [Burkholderia cenocepacia]MBR8041892.1 hypothetical protein [Burkholderia cenocepacia]MBR8074652.1 hypothetical protein [Burkholderia cenocepacia]MBR8324302.1 hypothetical protein [Burkholderia cenocepacia]HDR9804699.1 hypothetical protein [Burkholderia cenocepacia]HDR9812160.1 hypothetical protein [Burkholderia cenocepacia]
MTPHAASLMNVTRMIGAVFGVAMLPLAGAALAWRTAGPGTRAGAPKPIG